MRVSEIGAACILALGLWTAGVADARVTPLESPDEATCFEWKYPDKAECGELKSKTECKATATIDGSDDEKKKEACKPTKGDECFCD
jgi:hypothetical protein